MKTYYRCNNCFKSNLLSTNVNNRFELRDQFGETSTFVCKHCNTSQSIHVNNVRAKASILKSTVNIWGIVLSMILGGSVIYFYYDEIFETNLGMFEVLGIAISIPAIIASVILNEERKAIRNFNKNYV